MNGKPGDSPLTDLAHYGQHPLPPDIEELLLRIHDLGRKSRAVGRWARRLALRDPLFQVGAG